MKIETLVNLVGGELLNSPYISEITSYSNNSEKVVRGGCFFVLDDKNIKEAVQRGAYAIISQNYENIIDDEIAWIKVDSINDCIFDIVKYEKLNSTLFFVDDITASIIKNMNLSKNLLILNDLESLIDSLNVHNAVLVTSNEKFKSLFSEIIEPREIDVNLKQVTLFKSEFEGELLNLPYVYKKYFSKALGFFESNGLKYTLDFEIQRFKPVFVDYFFKEVPYGESEKVLITGIKNDRFFFEELNYLIENTKHAKTIIINESMKKMLLTPFNFAMTVDFYPEINKTEIQKDLF